jgi:hypothetical protein
MTYVVELRSNQAVYLNLKNSGVLSKQNVNVVSSVPTITIDRSFAVRGLFSNTWQRTQYTFGLFQDYA